MVKLLLKHLICELCIDVFFDKIKYNLFPITFYQIINESDIIQIKELFDKGTPFIQVTKWYARFKNIQVSLLDNKYQLLCNDMISVYNEYLNNGGSASLIDDYNGN